MFFFCKNLVFETYSKSEVKMFVKNLQKKNKKKVQNKKKLLFEHLLLLFLIDK